MGSNHIKLVRELFVVSHLNSLISSRTASNSDIFSCTGIVSGDSSTVSHGFDTVAPMSAPVARHLSPFTSGYWQFLNFLWGAAFLKCRHFQPGTGSPINFNSYASDSSTVSHGFDTVAPMSAPVARHLSPFTSGYWQFLNFLWGAAFLKCRHFQPGTGSPINFNSYAS
ncbi:hypothetical protein GOODEAATRI_029070 [Goodea atripinnis]|uniref:Uncharacterized protein n=1 Tax=Goodea atripinnis TaxID=208336 RepID=A0ABV0MW32_9TELE